ncbi:MAG: extracellular solute-binding protein [Actinobacteria bacterium]|nr:extracellular solute-binding protein [Actinomycetota bacterium]
MYKNKFIKLLVPLIVLFLFISLSLAGCKTTTTETTSAETTAAETTVAETTAAETTAAEPVNILWWDWQAGSNLVDVVNKLAEEFKKTHPNVTVERKEFAYADYNTALKTSLAAGEAPDVFEVHPGAPSNDLAQSGQLMDLTDIIKGDAEWSEWIAPALLLKDMYIDGKLYYVPMDVNHLPLNYWKPMFEERNLKPPTTIAELYEVAEVFKAEGIQPIATGFKDQWAMIDMFTVLVRTKDTTGDLIDRANLGQASWEDPLFKEAMQTIADLKDKGVIPSNVLEIGPWPEGIDMFVKKESAMFWPCGQYGLSSLPADALANDEIWDVPFPRLDENGKSLYTGGASITMGINPATPKAEIVIEFLKFLNGAFGQEVVFDSMRTPPGALVTKKSDVALFVRQTNDQNNMEIGYRYIDNPDIYKAVADGIQEALVGGDVDSILAKIEAASQEANK